LYNDDRSYVLCSRDLFAGVKSSASLRTGARFANGVDIAPPTGVAATIARGPPRIGAGVVPPMACISLSRASIARGYRSVRAWRHLGELNGA